MPDIHPIARFLSYEQRLCAAKGRYRHTQDGLRTRGGYCPLGRAFMDKGFKTPASYRVSVLIAGNYGYPAFEHPSKAPAYEFICRNDSNLFNPDAIPALFGVGPNGEDLLAS
jgi:hypothetical protein